PSTDSPGASAGSTPGPVEPDSDADPAQPPRQHFATLREAGAAAGKWVGAAIHEGALASDTTYREIAAREFDYVTPENATKWEPLAPSASSYDWTDADNIINFAADNQQLSKGHTLVWHIQYPTWISDSMSAAEVRSAMQNHIETTMARYKGKVRAWDVVNEAVDVASASGYTESIFWQKLGPEYIEDAF